jgi:hypothetical protein
MDTKKKKRKKPEPVASSDLEPTGEGILQGIHLDPFEESRYVYAGTEWLLEAGPDLADPDLGYVYTNDEPKAVDLTVTLDLANGYPTAVFMRTLSRGQSRFKVMMSGRRLHVCRVEPGETLGFKVLVTQTAAGDKLTIKGDYAHV